MLTRGALLVVIVVWVIPAQLPAREPSPVGWTEALRATLEVRFASYAEDGSDDARVAVLDVLDELALDAMARAPDLDAESLGRQLSRLPHAHAELRELREGERAVLWSGTEGGGRASLFARRQGTWRLLGRVDAVAAGSTLTTIVVADGVLVLADRFPTFEPKVRAFALAIEGDHILSATAGDVADVRLAGSEVRIARGREPRRISRWDVRREDQRLVATELPLTPWLDALEGFCSRAHVEVALPAVRAAVESCTGEYIPYQRWTTSGELVVELAMWRWCEDGGAWTQRYALHGHLTLARRDGRWQIIDVTRCEDLR